MSSSEDQAKGSCTFYFEQLADEQKQIMIETAYAEALYSVMHRVGRAEYSKETLYTFLKDTFEVEDEKHYELLQSIGEEQKPKMCVEVLVERAENLIAKDPNGFSDPYCMLGIQLGAGGFHGACDTNNIEATQVVTTKVQKATLDPVWNEKFILDVEDVLTDLFHLDIWDEDIEKGNLIEAASKVTDVNSIKGLGRFFKQIAQSTKGSDAQDDFLGCVTIPLKEVPGEGMNDWISLTSRFSKSSSVRGRIKVTLFIRSKQRYGKDVSQECDSLSAVRIYETLLTVFAEQQLRYAQTSEKWSGFIPRQATAILDQIAVQGNITTLQRSLSQWIVFVNLSNAARLDFKVLLGTLIDLDSKWIRTADHSTFQEASLNSSTASFVAQNLRLLQKHREIWPTATFEGQANMNGLLKCLGLIRRMSAFHKSGSDKQLKLQKDIELALTEGAESWVRTEIAARRPMTHDNDALIQCFTEVLREILQDLRLGQKYYDQIFVSDLGISYTKLIYRTYELELENELSAEIRDTVSRMDYDSAWAVHGPDLRSIQDRSMRAGTRLYELYIAIQNVVVFRHSVEGYEPAGKELTLHKFHEWFTDAVQNWFLMAKLKSKQIITNAFKIDVVENRLKALDRVEHSTSAVDASGCIKQIRLFWKELDWPDKPQSYPLIIKVLDAICDCTLHYVNLCHKELEAAGYFDTEGQFDVADEVCVILSNIEFVRDYILTLSKDLQVQDVLNAITETEGEVTAVQCRTGIEAMIQATDEEVINKTFKILSGLGEKIRPELRRCIQLAVRDSESKGVAEALEPLYEYLEQNLANAFNQLKRVNFYRFNQTIWSVMIDEFRDAAWQNRGKKQDFFLRLEEALEKMATHMHAAGNGLSIQEIRSPKFKDLKELLTRMLSPSHDIIADYFISRINKQNDRIEAIRPGAHLFGFLAVKAALVSNARELYIQVLRARDLVAMDSNGKSDPFVQVELLPRFSFEETPSQKTKVVKNTIDPIWGEELVFKLREIKQDFHPSMCIRFTVIDRDLVGSNDFEGECFLAFRDLPIIDSISVTSLDIVDMPLSQPHEEDMFLGILEKRSWDPEATKFVREQRKKQITSEDQ